MDAETRKRVENALKPYKPKHYFLAYKGKQFPINFSPKTGKCSSCKKSIGDEYINTYGKISKIKCTELHHLKYDDDHPLDNTIELCPSCHAKITYKTTIGVIPLQKTIEIFEQTGKLIHRYKDYRNLRS